MSTRLLVISDPGCPASTRYRISQFEVFLQSKGVHLQVMDWPRGTSESASRAELMNQLLDGVAQADAVVFQRYLPNGANFRRVRKRARRLAYDFDDAVIYSESTRTSPHLMFRRAWRFRRMIRNCDAVTAGNNYLASMARRYTSHDRVHIIPTTVELKKYHHELDPGSLHTTSPPCTGPVIGWIGSRSTLPYLEKLRRPLERLAEEFPGLTVRAIADQTPNLGKTPIELVRWDGLTEVRELKRLRIGLAPLPDDAWTRGKCGLRLLQYCAAGIPAVASPVGTQSELTESGAALAATSDDDWFHALRRLLTNEDLASTLAGRGKQLVRERFDAQVLAPSLYSIWCGTP